MSTFTHGIILTVNYKTILMKEFGLTLQFPIGGKCERCNCILEIYSSYQDQKIAYRLGSKKKFLCIICAKIPTTQSKNVRVTSEEIDQYLRSLINKVIN